jgi:hypothetical protein
VKTAWIWSPEARTQLRNIDLENAMRVRYRSTEPGRPLVLAIQKRGGAYRD